MVRDLMLWPLPLAASMTTAAQTSAVSAWLGRPDLMPSIESQQMMPSLADVPIETKGTLQIAGSHRRLRWRGRRANAAIRAKLTGLVELELAIAADGSVAAARVTKSLDKEHGLDHQAMVAARYWLFEPARLNGEAVSSRVVLQLEFRLH